MYLSPTTTKPMMLLQGYPYVGLRGKQPSFGANKTNEALTDQFDKAFNTEDPQDLLAWVSTKLPSLHQSNDKAPLSTEVRESGGHIQIHHGNEVICLPAQDSPWSHDYIGDGVRTMDPWPQAQWSSEWPPDEKTSLGKFTCKPVQNNGTHITFMEPKDPDIGAAYGIHPRTLVATNPKDASVTLVFQIENQHPNKTMKWAPWGILPAQVPTGTGEDPSMLIAFLTSGQDKGKIALSPSVDPIYRWNCFPSTKRSDLMIVNPQSTLENPIDKLLFRNVKWSVLAKKGASDVILLRSLYQHPDQFQVYNGHNRYVELEYTGPCVPSGKKSTAVMKLDFIPVSALSNGQFSTFGKTGDLKQELKIVVQALQNRLHLK